LHFPEPPEFYCEDVFAASGYKNPYEVRCFHEKDNVVSDEYDLLAVARLAEKLWIARMKNSSLYFDSGDLTAHSKM
jgi:hypothetical protein